MCIEDISRGIIPPLTPSWYVTVHNKNKGVIYNANGYIIFGFFFFLLWRC